MHAVTQETQVLQETCSLLCALTEEGDYVQHAEVAEGLQMGHQKSEGTLQKEHNLCCTFAAQGPRSSLERK